MLAQVNTEQFPQASHFVAVRVLLATASAKAPRNELHQSSTLPCQAKGQGNWPISWQQLLFLLQDPPRAATAEFNRWYPDLHLFKKKKNKKQHNSKTNPSHPWLTARRNTMENDSNKQKADQGIWVKQQQSQAVKAPESIIHQFPSLSLLPWKQMLFSYIFLKFPATW